MCPEYESYWLAVCFFYALCFRSSSQGCSSETNTKRVTPSQMTKRGKGRWGGGGVKEVDGTTMAT